MKEFEYSDKLVKVLKKLFKKDRSKYESIIKKIEEVVNSSDLSYYKNLRYNLKDTKRVHIGSFVLIFRVIGDVIYFDDIDHHDNIYK